MDAQNFDLDQVLINLTDKKGSSSFTIRDAVEGVSIMGSNGSGKSSGSAKTFALKYLSYGMGGLILTVKPDEKLTWLEYLKQTNRLDDLILVEPGGKYHFDFLGYEAAHRVDGLAISENIAAVLEAVIDSNEEKSRGNVSDPFWQDSLHNFLVQLTDLSLLAYDTVSVKALYDLALTVPKKGHEQTGKPKRYSFIHAFEAARKKVERLAKALAATLPQTEQEKLSDDDTYDQWVVDNIGEGALFRSLDLFFHDHFKNLADKTRSVIEFSLHGLLFRLLREPIYSLFCREDSNFLPEQCYTEGKIILVNLPTKLYHKAGRDIQTAIKFIYQRAMERRNISENGRPVFLFADEAQEFLTPYDSSFNAVSRSSRVCTVYITQNLSSYHANMGGAAKSEHKVLSLLGVFGTKIFHNNSHVETNNWASDLIGSAYVEDESRSTSVSGKFSSSRNTSYKLEKMVRPEELSGLRTGGPKNAYMVDAIMHRQNNLFHSGMNYLHISFKQ